MLRAESPLHPICPRNGKRITFSFSKVFIRNFRVIVSFGQIALVEYVLRLILMKSGFRSTGWSPGGEERLTRLHAHCERSLETVYASALHTALPRQQRCCPRKMGFSEPS